MAVFQFSALSDGQSISFNPDADVLNIDPFGISAANLRVTATGTSTHVEVIDGQQAGKDFTLLNVSPLQLATTNFTFANGSLLLFGDNTPGTANDNLANSLTGTAGRDLLQGFGGADTMNGGLDNDVYVVGAGDVLSDTGGFDTVLSDVTWALADGFENLTLTGTGNIAATGNNAANILVGNSGNNFFNPRGGDDTIQAGAGNDLIRLGGGGVPSYGNKVIDGGVGFDQLEFGGFGKSAIVVDLTAGTLSGGGENGAGSARLTGIESVVGDAFDDRITGSAVADSLAGGGGNDTLSGLGDNDTLVGGAGQDLFVFASAPGGAGDVVTDFVSATDRLSFSSFNFPALGTPGNLVAGDARFAAGPGFTSGHDASDRLIYNTTTGQLFYDADGNGAGSAVVVATLQGAPALAATDIQVAAQTQGTAGDDSLTGSAGNDTIAGFGGNDTINGLAGDDMLFGGPGLDSLLGGDGNDTLDGNNDAFVTEIDTMDGGAGNDTYVLWEQPNDVITDPAGLDTIVAHGGATWILPAGVENLVLADVNGLSTNSDAQLTGNELNNVIRNDDHSSQPGRTAFIDGGDGNDTLIGGTGTDHFIFAAGSGSYGNDSVDGGVWLDDLTVGQYSAVVVDFRAGTVVGGGTGGSGSVHFTNIEGVTSGAFDDGLVGNDSGVFLTGGGGNDTLLGGAGDDFLAGDGNSETGNDQISGGAGNDHISGGRGNNLMDGGAGDDTFLLDATPGLGFDTITGGGGLDVIGLQGASGPVVVDLSTNSITGAGLDGRVTFSGIDGFSEFGSFNDHLIGNADANLLEASIGDDLLEGGAGNDTLIGGNLDPEDPAGGNNTLDGGLGNDSLVGTNEIDNFLFRAPNQGVDRVAGFATSQYRVVFDNSGFTAIGSAGTFASGDARFFAGAGATSGQDASDRIVYDTSTGNLYYDADGSGAGAAQLVATLEGRSALAATDVAVVGSGGAPAPGATIVGTAGNDTLNGTDGNDTIDGLGGDDVLTGGLGIDLLRGGDGNDRLKDRDDSNLAAPDTLDGGLGNDIYDFLANPARPHSTVIVDAGGVDTVWSNHDFVLPTEIENLTLFEGRVGTGNELDNMMVAFGNVGQYTMDGAGGNDTLLGATNSLEDMRGGAGSDVFAFSGTPADPSQLALDTLNDFVSGTDTIQLDNTGFANLGAPGRFSATDERFFSSFGARAAHDASDRVIYDQGSGVVFYDPDGTGPAAIQAVAFLQGANPALVASDFTVVGASPTQGTAGNDSLTGTEGNDSLAGLAGNDTINALGGNDTLDGGAGIDNLNGGLGNDTYIVTAGDVLSDTGGIDTVVSDANWLLADGFENLTAIGPSGVALTGNNAANVLFGNAASNFFNPRGGDDTIRGGDAADLVRLGGGGVPSYGNKLIDGGTGFDTLEFGGFARSAIVVDLAASSLVGGGDAGQGSATLISIERVTGDGFNDRISGSAVAEELNGGGGNDTINGRGANDTLTGGLGADTFVFDTAPSAGNVDQVTDFVSASDRLDFDNALFSALGADGNFAAGDARFAAGAGFTAGRDASDRVVYDTNTGNLYYDADGNGAGAAQLVATIQGHPAVAATDITVI